MRYNNYNGRTTLYSPITRSPLGPMRFPFAKTNGRKKCIVLLSIGLVLFCAFTLFSAGANCTIRNCETSTTNVPVKRNVTVDACNDPFSDRKFDIVFDAGSTGTRIHVFEYYRSYYNKNTGEEIHPSELLQRAERGESFQQFNLDEQFSLLHDHVKKITPGLSAYSLRPSDAGESLEELLLFAKKVISDASSLSSASCVGITLKATAGMRLLPPAQQGAILSDVEEFLRDNTVLRVKDFSVEIIDGRDEGMFSWLTLNYILGRLDLSPNTTTRFYDNVSTVEHGSTVATVDMGGASSQVVFELDKKDGAWLPFTYFTPLKVYQSVSKNGNRRRRRPIYLYQHSYLGLGLNEARKRLLQQLEEVKESAAKDACFASRAGEEKVKACTALFVRHVLQSREESVEDPKKSCTHRSCGMQAVPQPVIQSDRMEVYVFSFFTDMIDRYCGDMCSKSAEFTVRTIDDGKTNMKVVPVSVYRRMAEKLCTETVYSLEEYLSASGDTPTTCLDVVYLYAYLSFGLEMKDTALVYVPEMVNGFSVAWPLGASLMQVNEMLDPTVE